MDSGMYRDIFATEFVDMFPQTNGDIWKCLRQQRGYAGNRCGTVLKYSSCGDGLFAVKER